MPYDYIEEYQKQNDDTIWEFRDKDAQSKIDISSTETDYANPLTFETMQAQLAENTKIKLEPIQDLHGYDKPWVGGAGKNIYEGSPSFDRYGNLNYWTKETETYNGHEVYSYTLQWKGLAKLLTIPVGIYTFSCMVKTSDVTTLGIYLTTGTTTATLSPLNSTFESLTSWTKYSLTFEVTTAGTIQPRLENSLTNGAKVYVSEYQLEKASSASSYESYTNICPITGRTQVGVLGCGKNLVTSENIIDNAYINGGSSATISSGNAQMCYVRAYPNKKYTISKRLSARFTVSLCDELPQIGVLTYGRIIRNDATSITIETQATTKYICIYYYAQSADTLTAQEIFNTLQCEIAETASTYEAYKESNSLTISFGQTVYGGQVDVEKGVLTIAYVADTTTWGDGTNETVLGNNTRKRLPNLSYISKSNDGISNVAPYLQNWDSDITHFYIQVNQQCYCFLPNDTDNDTQIQVCYELATPITINLTPNTINLLKGINNISTDGTIITLTYRNGVFATLEELSDLDTNVKDISDKFNALGLSVVDGKLCQTYNT